MNCHNYVLHKEINDNIEQLNSYLNLQRMREKQQSVFTSVLAHRKTQHTYLLVYSTVLFCHREVYIWRSSFHIVCSCAALFSHLLLLFWIIVILCLSASRQTRYNVHTNQAQQMKIRNIKQTIITYSVYS